MRRTTSKQTLVERITLGALLVAALIAVPYVALLTTADDRHASTVTIATIGFVAALIAVVAISVALVRSVATPARRVADAARRFERGDFSTRVPEEGLNDLRKLAASLNAMAGALAIARDELDGQRADVSAFRDEAARATQAKNEFLSRMSHELRTPLNAILGFAQLLELDELDARQRDNVAHIVSGGRHLLDLINEVLEISKIEAGSINPAIEPVHAGDMVQQVIELVGPLASQRDIELRANLKGHDKVWVAADPQQLKQVLLNLLANAVKYNRDGGSVTVNMTHNDGWARILVVDTGMGIPQDQLPKLFVPFERLGAESTGVEGTGLGLVLALRLIEAMGGRLGVESQPWIGSTFHIELPVTEAPAPVAVEAPAPRLVSATHTVPSDARTRRVLYIEDDPANARLMAELFTEDPRLKLMTTMQGSLGLELSRRHQPDLVLLDLHLPDMDGQDVIRRLRNDPLTATIPVIAVSADATDQTRRRLMMLGAARYLTKPLSLSAVMSAVWEVLEDAPGKAALPSAEAGIR